LLTQASRDDSIDLIGSEAATGLKTGQGVLADADRGTEPKVCTFSIPSAPWLADFNNVAR
jgi:hypothetical protein